MYVCISLFMQYIYIYICVYVYVYIYIYIYIYIYHTPSEALPTCKTQLPSPLFLLLLSGLLLPGLLLLSLPQALPTCKSRAISMYTYIYIYIYIYIKM